MDTFTFSSLLFFIKFISNAEGNGAEDRIVEATALKWEAHSSSSRLLSNENKNPRGFSNSNFEIGESSKYEGTQGLDENAIKEETRDIFWDYSSDGMKFECKSEEEEDDVIDDVGEIEEDKPSRNKIYKYAVEDSNKNLVIYEIELYCEECGEPFGTIRNFEKHIKRFHRKKKIFACKYGNCETGFTRLCNLYTHQLKTHGLRFQNVRLNSTRSGEQGIVCYVCCEVSQSVTEFERHYAKFHKEEEKLVLKEEHYIGENEENNDTSKKKIFKYVAIGPDQHVTPYEIEGYCEECNEPFDTIRSLEKHFDRFHPKKKIFICKYENCGNSYTRLCNLYTHYLKTHGLRFQKDRLNRTLSGELVVVCHKCGETYQSMTEFERHKAEVHKKEKKPVLKEEDHISSSYPSYGAKIEHRYEAEIDDSEADIGENKGNNDFCKRKIFKYMAVGPDQNVITYEVEAYCEECDESFDTVMDFEKHFDQSHRKMKFFTCNFENCGKSFAKFTSLNRHHLRVHELHFQKKLPSNVNVDEFLGEFPTYCEECRLECNTANSLETHARKHHPSRKIFTCMVTDCPSGFTRAGILMKHLSVKHGCHIKRNRDIIEAKSANCRLCGHFFINMKDLYSHAKEAHPTEDLRTFCTPTYTTTGNKNKHEKVIHGSTDHFPKFCRYCDKPFIRWDYMPFHEKNCKKRKRPQLEDVPSTPGDVYECEVSQRSA